MSVESQNKGVAISAVDLFGCTFDADFFKEHYPEFGTLNERELLDLWSAESSKKDWLPNDEIAVKFYAQDKGLPLDFDVDEYLFLNPDIRNTLRWKYQAVCHYFEHGMKENRIYSVSGDLERKNNFDWRCYQILNPDLADFTREDLFDHWFKYGLAEGRHSNFSDYELDLHGKKVVDQSFSVPSYINLNKDLIGQYDDHRYYLKHYLDFGVAENRPYMSDIVDDEFVRALYGVRLKKVDASTALEILRSESRYDALVPVFLNAAEICNYFGVRDDGFLEIFDHDAYVHLNGDVTSHLNGAYKATCLHHYLTTGKYLACDICYENYFDTRFYALQYQDIVFGSIAKFNFYQEEYSAVQSQALYDHWIDFGMHCGLQPNLSAFVEPIIGRSLPSVIEQEIVDYRAMRKHTERTEIPGVSAEKYIQSGWDMVPRTGVLPKSTCGFFCGVAHKLNIDGERESAIKLYELVLETEQGYPEALHNIGDEYKKAGFYRGAIECYKKLVESNSAFEWTFLNCAACYEKVGDFLSAAMVLKKGKACYPTDLTISGLYEEKRKTQFYKTYEKARKVAVGENVEAARALLKESLDFLEDVGEGGKVNRESKRIAIVGNFDLPQCRFYRVEQKVELLETQGYKVSLYSHSQPLSGFYSELETLEAVIFYRVPAFPEIIDAINATNIEGIPSIYDVDDLIFDDSEFPPPYSTYANQITIDQYNSMALDTCLVANAMTRCTHGMSSTDTLANYMKPYVKTGVVFTLRNGLSSQHKNAVRRYKARENSGDFTTVFYGSGTKAHKQEFHELIEPVFLKLYRKYGDKICFVLVGSFEKTDLLQEIREAITVVDQIGSIDQYWAVLAEYADINLSVLARSAVTDSKSEIKWLEAGMFGIPSVVSRTSAFEECTINKENILLCDSSDDFFANIDSLVGNKELSRSIGQNAKDFINNKYSIEYQASEITQFIKQAKSVDVGSTSDSMKVKVAVVNVFYPPEAIGGATRVVHDNVLELAEKYDEQIEIEVFCTNSGHVPYATKKYLDNSIRVTAVTAPDGSDHQLSDKTMGGCFKEFLKNFNPDIVHFHCIQRLTESIVTVTRECGIPYVITAHDGWWVSDQQFINDSNDEQSIYDYDLSMMEVISSGSSRQLILKDEVENAEAILAVSDAFKCVYERAGLKNVLTVQNGVSNLGALPDRNPSDKLVLGHVGGTERHKGLHLIRNALHSLPGLANLELLVVDHAAKIGSSYEEVWGNTRVKFVAKTAQKNVAELYGKVDVLIAPSVWPESFGLVSREALHYGCWVVASDRGAIGSDVVDGVNGHIVNVESNKEISEILTRLNEDFKKYRVASPKVSPLRKSEDQATELFGIYNKIKTELLGNLDNQMLMDPS